MILLGFGVLLGGHALYQVFRRSEAELSWWRDHSTAAVVLCGPIMLLLSKRHRYIVMAVVQLLMSVSLVVGGTVVMVL